jgi:hypothetical protein
MYYQNYRVLSVTADFDQAWYPIGIGWFDFDFDYFAAMSDTALSKVRSGNLRILFYYHEGDNPKNIKHRLDTLAVQNGIDCNCYVFVSSNTQAGTLKNFLYFPDHEFFFRHVNRRQSVERRDSACQYKFTVLNRLPKWWRASIISDLLHQGLLTNSLVSYNTINSALDEDENDNPIEVDCIPGWRQRARALSQTQLVCDQLDSVQQNDHHFVNTDLYTQSHCSIVLETHFDVDQSGGAFLTEKTFKPIKYGQPFVIAGGPGSLQALRDLGYRVFDSIIDNEYDNIVDNTQRYFALRGTIEKIANNQNFYAQCLEDTEYNQKIFQQRINEPLNTFIKDLSCLSQ